MRWPSFTAQTDPPRGAAGRKLVRPGLRFIAIGLLPLVAGLLLLFLASGWPWVLGIVLIALSLPILAVGGSLLAGGGVAQWGARRKPFA
jgi:hypothetical protein